MAAPDPLLLGKAPAPVAENHPRSPLVSGLLALLCPGLGHLYCGAVAPMVLWTLAPHLALIGMMFIGAFDTDRLHLWTAGGAAAWISLRLAQVWLAAKLAKTLGRYSLRRLNHPAIYLAFFLGTSMFSSLLSLPFRELVVEPFKVPTESMEPTLVVGDQFFVLKRLLPISRGDVIVYRRSEAFVKRVVAVGGDTVQLRSGVLFVNGVEQAQLPCPQPNAPAGCMVEAGRQIIAGARAAADFETITVPERQLFMLGDNRGSSVDSRIHGTVPIADVIGQASVVFFSVGPGLALRTERIGLQP